MEKKINIFSFTEQGSKKNEQLRRLFREKGIACEGYAMQRFSDKYNLAKMPKELKEWIGERWEEEDFFFIGATGIAVRMIAPWICDKYSDSAVVVMDECAKYVIPLLSGHVGGGIKLANIVSECTGAAAVITTATDVQKKFAVDVFAKENGLEITSRELAKKISAAILEGKTVGFYSEYEIDCKIPKELERCMKLEELKQYEYGIVVAGFRKEEAFRVDMPGILVLYSKPYVVGIGCRKQIEPQKLEEEMNTVLGEHGILTQEIGALASIDLKKEEKAILEFAHKYRIPFFTYSVEELNRVKNVSCSSSFVASVTGVDNVCERSAKVCCPDGEMVLPKQKREQMTVAVMKKEIRIAF